MRIGDCGQALDPLDGVVEHSWRDGGRLSHVDVHHVDCSSLAHVALTSDPVEPVFESGDASGVLPEGVDDFVHVISEFLGAVWEGEVKVWRGEANSGLGHGGEWCLGDIVCSWVAIEGTRVRRIHVLGCIERWAIVHIWHWIGRRGRSSHTSSCEKTTSDFALKMKGHHGVDVSSTVDLAEFLSTDR